MRSTVAGFTGAAGRFVRPQLIRAGYHSRPAFLIIGAQKAGTTALFYYLADHPDLVESSDKELSFFVPELFADWPEHPRHDVLWSGTESAFSSPEVHRRALRWYHAQFPLPHRLGRRRLTFEATPEYLYYPLAAERIWRYDPNLKLIVLLREPVGRAFSAWNMYRAFGDYRAPVYAAKRELRGFDEAVRTEVEEIRAGAARLEPGYVQRGFYAEQLGRYLARFSGDHLLIVDSRDLEADAASVLDRVAEFLGIGPYPSHGARESIHVGHYDAAIPDATALFLRDVYRPHNERLYELLGRDLGW